MFSGTRRRRLTTLLLATLWVVATAGAAAKTTLTFTVLGSTPVPGLEPAVAAFQKIHPDVDVQFVYEAGLTDSPTHPYAAKVIAMAAGGTPPDLTWVAGQTVPQYAVQGLLLPLDDFIRASGVREADFIPPAWQQTRWGGHTYAMTMWVDPNFALIWNKTLFAQAGLDPDRAPATLSEYESHFKKLTRTGADGKITQIGARPWDVYGGANTTFTWGWVFGGDFFDYDRNKVTATHPRVVEAVEWVREYYTRYANAGNFGAFQDGKEGMRFLLAATTRGLIRDFPDLEIGVGYEPYKEEAGAPNPSWIGGFAAGIMRGSKNPQMAWEFLKFLTATPEGTGVFAAGSGLMPAYLRSPHYRELVKDPHMKVYLDIAQNARYRRPSIPVTADYMAALDQAFKDVMSGKQQPKDALQFAQDQIQRKLDAVLSGSR